MFISTLENMREEIKQAKKICNATDETVIKACFSLLNEDTGEYYNEKGKHKLCRGIAHYIFRNGPVEDMHADGKLSDDDMKVLNKFMINRLGKLYDLFIKNKLNIEVLYSLCISENYGIQWDDFENIDDM